MLCLPPSRPDDSTAHCHLHVVSRFDFQTGGFTLDLMPSVAVPGGSRRRVGGTPDKIRGPSGFKIRRRKISDCLFFGWGWWLGRQGRARCWRAARYTGGQDPTVAQCGRKKNIVETLHKVYSTPINVPTYNGAILEKIIGGVNAQEFLIDSNRQPSSVSCPYHAP